jgi:transcriptional regulator with XRE-family HTH domain
MRIGHKIKKIRELKSLTQEEMASRLNMSQSNYSKLERDEMEFNMSRLEDISKILQIDLNELINFDEHTLFVIQNNKAVNGIQGTVTNHYNQSINDRERQLYEDKIQLLEEKIRYQQEKILFLENQLKTLQGTPYLSLNEAVPAKSGRKKPSAVK